MRSPCVDVKIVLLDNSAHGLVRQWQELFFDQNYSEVDLSDNPDFVEVAQSFGINALRIQQRSDVTRGIQRLLNSEGPCLMHFPSTRRPTSGPWCRQAPTTHK